MVFRYGRNDECWTTHIQKDIYQADQWMVDMHDLFLNIKILRKFENKWNVDMQLHAYLRSLTNNSVQYK